MAWLLLLLSIAAIVVLLIKNHDQSKAMRKVSDDAHSKTLQLQASLTARESEVKQLQHDLSVWRTAAQGLRTQLDAADQRADAHKDELAQVRLSLLRMDAALQEAQRNEQTAYADVQSVSWRMGELAAELERYAGIHDLERHLANLEAQKAELLRQSDAINSQKFALLQDIDALNQQLGPLQLDEYAQRFGLYEAKYDLGDASRYKVALEALRTQQKQLIKGKQAIRCEVTWRSNDSLEEGRRMIRQLMQLMLFAFNGEAEALISKVRFDNVDKVATRLQALFEKINALHGGTGTYITVEYLNLKLQELFLVHEYAEQKQREAEEQRAIREQMRDEERAQREFERALEEAEREARRYELALEKARVEAERAVGERQAALQREVERLGGLLEEARAQERSIAQAQLTRRGHVYVISNIGSFGEDVYKIGMTRRLEPLERVRELSNASVPFNFDVHAVIYAEDAPALEAALHRQFADRRLNRVNARKEFFRVSLGEIQQFVHRHHGQIDFTLAAEAHDFRISQQMPPATA